MKEQRKPWLDVPIEVLIEEERRKQQEKQEAERPRINIYAPAFTPSPHKEQPSKEDDYTIDFSLQ